MSASKSHADQSEDDRHVDAGDNYLTIEPTEFDRLIAGHRAINEAERNFARILDEVGQEVEAKAPPLPYQPTTASSI